MDVTEEENVMILTSTMADGDPETAGRNFQKHNGDMNKSATPIDTGAKDPWPGDFSFTDASTITLPTTPLLQYDGVPHVVQLLYCFP